jgi:CheY-like chemotaxis protein
MVVDDEELVRDLLAQLVEEIGLTNVTCANGQLAVDYFRYHHRQVCLVLLDLNMPVMSGAECFQALREIDPAIRIIISTGSARQSAGQADIFSTCTAVLEKPFSFESVEAEVKKALGLR